MKSLTICWRTEGNAIARREHTWGVETDAMDWETAISGMRTVERKLKELRESARVPGG